jgi:hypothetical protein
MCNPIPRNDIPFAQYVGANYDLRVDVSVVRLP